MSRRTTALFLLGIALDISCGNAASTPTPAAPANAGPASASVSAVDAQTLQCGIFNGSDHTSGSATTPAVYLLARADNSILPFTWNVGLRDMPAVGAYMCAHFRQGARDTIFVSIVVPGEPGYIAEH